jgi:hypothetical protein
MCAPSPAAHPSNISDCQKKLFWFSYGWKQFHSGRSFGFPVAFVIMESIMKRPVRDTWLNPVCLVCMPPNVCQYVCVVVLGLPVRYLFARFCRLYCTLHLINLKFPVLEHSPSIVNTYILLPILNITAPVCSHCLFMYVILTRSLRASHYVTDVEILQAGGGVMLLSLAYCSCGSDIIGWNGLCLIMVWGHRTTARSLFNDALSGLPAATDWYCTHPIVQTACIIICCQTWYGIIIITNVYNYLLACVSMYVCARVCVCLPVCTFQM